MGQYMYFDTGTINQKYVLILQTLLSIVTALSAKNTQKQLLAIVRSRKYLKLVSIHVVLFEGAIDDCRYSRRSLSRTPVISNILACPLNFSSNSRLKNIRYLELRYLELSLSRTNYLVPYTVFRSLSRTFVRIFKLECSNFGMFVLKDELAVRKQSSIFNFFEKK